MRHWWLLLVLCCACVDDLQIDLPEAAEQRKVIEGFVERGTDEYLFFANVSRTQNVTGDFVAEDIPSELVIVYNDAHRIPIPANIPIKMNRDAFHADFGGQPETARFRLEASVEGQMYQSGEATITPVPAPDSLSIELESRRELNTAGNIVSRPYVRLRVHTPLANTDNQPVSLNWFVSTVYEFQEAPRADPFFEPSVCYVDWSPFRNDVNIANAKDFAGRERLDYYEIAEVGVGFRFAIKLYFTTVQKSLSQEAVEYWTEVQNSNDRSGNLYDVFPGRIRTNISNIDNPDEVVNGYFHASAVDTIRLEVRPLAVGNPFRFCHMWEEPMVIEPDDPDPCLDCLKLRNSTLQRPHFWRL